MVMAVQFANPRPLRSGPSRQSVFLQYKNCTTRDIKLYWLDYQGRQSYYLTLEPRASAKVNTYTSHPWIFCDRSTGERMQIKQRDVYWPRPYIMPDPVHQHRLVTCRKEARIHFPMRTLRENCILQLSSILASQSGKRTDKALEETLDALYLPFMLREELKFSIEAMENHRSEVVEERIVSYVEPTDWTIA